MHVPRSTLPVIVSVAMVVLIGSAAPVGAQCAVANVSSGPGPPIYIVKTVTGTMCQLTMAMNADCFPGGNNPPVIGAMRTSALGVPLSATQVVGLMSPSCGWQCSMSACQVVTDTSEGLPVELMEFSVESEEEADSGPTEQDES
jgi:hypothetical protein